MKLCLFVLLSLVVHSAVQAAPKSSCVLKLSRFVSEYSDGYMDGIPTHLANKMDIVKLTKAEISAFLRNASDTKEILENKEELEFTINESLRKNEKSLKDLEAEAEAITKKIERYSKSKNEKKMKEIQVEMKETIWTMNQIFANTRYLNELQEYIDSLERGDTPTLH